VNGQLAYIWDNFAAHPQYRGLWQEFEGKPLVLALDISASYLNEGFRLDDRFTVRFVGAQQDINKLNERGLWSWMDSQRPAPTRRGNAVEALTVSVGSFAAGGWLGKDARGRRNGATLIEDWQSRCASDRSSCRFTSFRNSPDSSKVSPPHRPMRTTMSTARNSATTSSRPRSLRTLIAVKALGILLPQPAPRPRGPLSPACPGKRRSLRSPGHCNAKSSAPIPWKCNGARWAASDRLYVVGQRPRRRWRREGALRPSGVACPARRAREATSRGRRHARELSS